MATEATTAEVQVLETDWQGTDDPTQVEVLARLLFGGDGP